jgi:hypothetical protein
VLDDISERTFGILKKWLYAQQLAKPDSLREKYKVRVRFVKGYSRHTRERVYDYATLEEYDPETMGLQSDNEAKRVVYLRGRFAAFDYLELKFWHWDDFVNVYIMADKYDFLHLRDDVVRQWQWQASNYRSHCMIETVARAFKNLP